MDLGPHVQTKPSSLCRIRLENLKSQKLTEQSSLCQLCCLLSPVPNSVLPTCRTASQEQVKVGQANIRNTAIWNTREADNYTTRVLTHPQYRPHHRSLCWNTESVSQSSYRLKRLKRLKSHVTCRSLLICLKRPVDTGIINLWDSQSTLGSSSDMGQ